MSQYTVLIADCSEQVLSALSRRCEAMGLRAVCAANGLEAMTVIARQPPDLAILSLNLPDADGLAVCEQMSRDEATFLIPAIIFSSSADPETIRRCEACGAFHVLKSRHAWREIEGIIKTELFPADASSQPVVQVQDQPVPLGGDNPGPTILIVDDDLNILRTFEIGLTAYGARVVTAKDGMEGFAAALVERPDVIVTDYSMPRGSGDYLLSRLRGDPETRDIPVIVLTARKFGRDEDRALKRDLVGRGGAVAYLTKPVALDAFIGEIQKHAPLSLQLGGT